MRGTSSDEHIITELTTEYESVMTVLNGIQTSTTISISAAFTFMLFAVEREGVERILIVALLGLSAAIGFCMERKIGVTKTTTNDLLKQTTNSVKDTLAHIKSIRTIVLNDALTTLARVSNAWLIQSALLTAGIVFTIWTVFD